MGPKGARDAMTQPIPPAPDWLEQLTIDRITEPLRTAPPPGYPSATPPQDYTRPLMLTASALVGLVLLKRLIR